MGASNELTGRLRDVWRARGALGFLRFAVSRLVRVSRVLVFERKLADGISDRIEIDMPTILTIDRHNLDDPSVASVVDRALGGESNVYRFGLQKNGLMFCVNGNCGTLMHYSFVEFETRYKKVLDEDDATPMFSNCWTAPDARGNRFFSSTLRYGCCVLASKGFDRVLITCDPENIASVKGIQRAGFNLIRNITSLLLVSRLAIQRVSESGRKPRWRAARL